MSNGAICGKCRRGRIVNGKCTACGTQIMGKDRVSNALPLGHFLNNRRYRIDRVLGEGGYGITYEVWDFKEGRKVALKEFFPAYALKRDPNRIDSVCIDQKVAYNLAHTRVRFNEEAALLFKLKNVKEIVDVYHGFEENKTAYYTMELLQGADMQKHLRMYGCMYWAELGPIVIQILRALNAMHQMGYIHRDVTPDNIFLLYNGTAQLIDLGSARQFVSDQSMTKITKDRFAPYEQYEPDGNEGPWTDIYSLCVTIAYALTGSLPDKAKKGKEIILPTLPGVPSCVNNAIRIGTSTDERKRYQSIAEFVDALFPGRDIFKELQGGTPQQTANYRQNEEQKRKDETQAFRQNRSVTMPVQRQTENIYKKEKRTWTANGANSTCMLACVQGVMKGGRLSFTNSKIQSVGRGFGKVIQYPDDTSGVSRNQCSFVLHANGMVYVRDDNSSYGTTVNGQRLPPYQWVALKRGDMILFGKEMYILY